MTTTHDGAALVARAATDLLTPSATDRLQQAVGTHNDGRVRRHLLRAAAAREAAAEIEDDPDKAQRLLDAWAGHLHRALDESWPVGHPAYRRHD